MCCVQQAVDRSLTAAVLLRCRYYVTCAITQNLCFRYARVLESSHCYVLHLISRLLMTVATVCTAEVHHQDHLYGPRVCNWIILLTAMA